MSNQSVNIGNEKQIASYSSEFRESRLAKPQDVSLTITAGHIHGRAFIWEREGTKEGDAEYQRFTCSLEEITKVYINENVKANPLYIQCDSMVKNVFHRKTIVVPCLENAQAVAEQINTVREQYMQKYEAQQQKEMERKRAALEAERLKEQAEAEEKSSIHSLPPVDKFVASLPPDDDQPDAADSPVLSANSKKGTPSPAVSAMSLNSEVEESIKALEKLESVKIPVNPVANAVKPKTETSAVPVPPVADAKINELPPVPSIDDELPPVHEILPADELMEALAAAEGIVPQTSPAVSVTETDTGNSVKFVSEETPKNGTLFENVPDAAHGLDKFENGVRALKERLDSGEMTIEGFKAERKQLIAASLY